MPISPTFTLNLPLVKRSGTSCNFCCARFDGVIHDTRAMPCGRIAQTLVVIDEAKFIARGGEYKI